MYRPRTSFTASVELSPNLKDWWPQRSQPQYCVTGVAPPHSESVQQGGTAMRFLISHWFLLQVNISVEEEEGGVTWSWYTAVGFPPFIWVR